MSYLPMLRKVEKKSWNQIQIRIKMSMKPDRRRVKIYVQKKIQVHWSSSFWVTTPDKQTDRQTDRQMKSLGIERGLDKIKFFMTYIPLGVKIKLIFTLRLIASEILMNEHKASDNRGI